MKMTKIIFTGTNFEGQGSAAMLICSSKTLKRFIANTEFVVASKHPKFDSQRGIQYGLRFFSSYYSRYDVKVLSSFLHMLGELVNADFVVDLSGFSFTDLFGRFHTIGVSLNVLLCKLLGKRIVLFSQAMGPFNSRMNRLLARLFLPRADLIVVRGETTRDYLHGIGIRNQVYIYADSAFLLEPAPSKRVHQILQKEGIKRKDSGKLLIGLSVNTRIYERSDTKESENCYLRLIVQLIDHLTERLNAEVVLIPYEISPSGYDDRLIARKIYKIARNKHRIKLIENEYAPQEVKGVIGTFDLFIGSRFHSIIASTSMLIPTIAIAWSHKYYETMKTLGQEKYVCHFKATSFRQLAHLAEDALSRKEEIREQLKIRVEKAKQSAFEGVKLLAAYFTKSLTSR